MGARGERLGDKCFARYGVTRKVLHIYERASMQKIALNEQGRRIGESHPNAKLSDRDVELVLELREAGFSLRAIAEKMDVKKECIWKIVHGYRRGQAIARVVSVKS